MGRTDKQKQANIEKYTTKEPLPSTSATPSQGAPMPLEVDPSPDLTMNSILIDIKGSIDTLSSKIDNAVVKLELMQSQINTLNTRTTETESRISTTEDNVATITTKVDAMEAQLKKLTEKTEDLEGRSRRSNIRILGVPEGTERGRVEIFVEELIQRTLGSEGLSPQFVIERAHRTLGPRPVAGMRPRPILAKTLNYRDRDTILRRAREKGEVVYEGAKLMFFPDFSPAVQRARKTFDHARKTLRERGIPYSMLFPSKLKIIHGSKTLFYDDPAQVMEFIEALPDPS